MPEEYFIIEGEKKYVDPDCLKQPTRQVEPIKPNSVSDEKFSEREAVQKEYDKLREKKYFLEERMHRLREEINDQKEVLRKFPDNEAIKNSIKIKENQYKDQRRELQEIVRRMNYLIPKLF